MYFYTTDAIIRDLKKSMRIFVHIMCIYLIQYCRKKHKYAFYSNIYYVCVPLFGRNVNNITFYHFNA